MMRTPNPTAQQAQTALDVLLWLHENCGSGADRDDISHVRHLLGVHPLAAEILEGLR